MLDNPITNDEVLYRRVPDNKRLLKTLPNGTTKVSSQAFFESTHRPSVDRAKLRENDPTQTLSLYEGEAGVVSLITYDVRAINDLVQYDKDQQPIQTFTVDV